MWLHLKQQIWIKDYPIRYFRWINELFFKTEGLRRCCRCRIIHTVRCWVAAQCFWSSPTQLLAWKKKGEQPYWLHRENQWKRNVKDVQAQPMQGHRPGTWKPKAFLLCFSLRASAATSLRSLPAADAVGSGLLSRLAKEGKDMLHSFFFYSASKNIFNSVHINITNPVKTVFFSLVRDWEKI